MAEVVRGIVAAILDALLPLLAKPTKAVDAPRTPDALRGALRDRVRRVESGARAAG